MSNKFTQEPTRSAVDTLYADRWDGVEGVEQASAFIQKKIGG